MGAPRASTTATTCCARRCSTCGRSPWGCRSRWPAGPTGGATRGRATCRSWRPPSPAPGTPTTPRAQLAFLQEVQRHDGWFEARYDIAHPPHARTTGSPSSTGRGGWCGARASSPRTAPDRAAELLAPLRPMLVRCARRLLASLDADDAAAAGLLGLLGARRAHADPRHGGRGARRPAQRDRGAAARGRDGARRPHRAPPPTSLARPGARAVRAAGLPAPARRLRRRRGRRPSSSHRSAARRSTTRCSRRSSRAQASMVRPAGGLAPGRRVEGRRRQLDPRDGAVRGGLGGHGPPRPGRGAARAGSGDHRTDAGSFPEKVLYDGRPAAVAPLAWTAALVVIARHELVHAVRRVRRRLARSSCSVARAASPGAGGRGAARRSPARRGGCRRAAAARRRGCARAVVVRPRRAATSRRCEAWPPRVRVGSLTVRAVRSRSCAVDGWLTLSSGRRAADLRRAVPRAAAGRRRPRAALGRVPRRRGRRLVRRPPGHARRGGHGIRRVCRDGRAGRGDRRRRAERAR